MFYISEKNVEEYAPESRFSGSFVPLWSRTCLWFGHVEKLLSQKYDSWDPKGKGSYLGLCLVQVIQDRLVNAGTAYSWLLVSGTGCKQLTINNESTWRITLTTPPDRLLLLSTIAYIISSFSGTVACNSLGGIVMDSLWHFPCMYIPSRRFTIQPQYVVFIQRLFMINSQVISNVTFFTFSS